MLAYLFVLLAIASRFLILKLVPHPWDFTPLGASLLFFGAYGPRRQWWIPVALFVAADVALSKLVYSYPLTWDLLISWAWYAGALYLGTRLRDNTKPVWVLGAALTSSLSFFLVSNFGVWVAYAMYPKTFAGLISCYVAGIPFYQHRFAGDLLFTGVLFSIPALLRSFRTALGNNGAAAV